MNESHHLSEDEVGAFLQDDDLSQGDPSDWDDPVYWRIKALSDLRMASNMLQGQPGSELFLQRAQVYGMLYVGTSMYRASLDMDSIRDHLANMAIHMEFGS